MKHTPPEPDRFFSTPISKGLFDKLDKHLTETVHSGTAGMQVSSTGEVTIMSKEDMRLPITKLTCK